MKQLSDICEGILSSDFDITPDDLTLGNTHKILVQGTMPITNIAQAKRMMQYLKPSAYDLPNYPGSKIGPSSPLRYIINFVANLTETELGRGLNNKYLNDKFHEVVGFGPEAKKLQIDVNCNYMAPEYYLNFSFLKKNYRSVVDPVVMRLKIRK